MIGVLLQVRLDSSRLPNKALLELGGRSVIEHAMLSLRRIPAAVHAIVTDEESRELLEPRAVKCGFGVAVGPRDDVLILSNHRSEYFQQFFDAELYFDAPMLKWANENVGACSWRWIEEHMDEFGDRTRDVNQDGLRGGGRHQPNSLAARRSYRQQQQACPQQSTGHARCDRPQWFHARPYANGIGM